MIPGADDPDVDRWLLHGHSVRNGGFARKFTSIWRTGVSARLGLAAKVPDQLTFSKNRHGRFRESDAPRHLFWRASFNDAYEGLVSAEGGFAVDASLIAADANKSSARFQARTGSLRRSGRARFAPHANISLRSTTRRSAQPPLSRRSSFPD